MRAATLGVIASLTLALASPPALAQIPNPIPNPNPELLKASWLTLNKVIAALERYYADFARYPQSIVELISIRGRQYIAELPVDPCTGAPFGGLTGYEYIPLGNPAGGYVLRTNWSWEGYGTECHAANGHANIIYSPSRGLQLTP